MTDNNLEKSILKKVNYFFGESNDYHFKNINEINDWRENILMIVLENYTAIKLTNKEMDYLLKNSDLRQVNKDGWDSLMFAFIYGNEVPTLNNEQLDYLIKNSDLKRSARERWTCLTYALEMDDDANLKLSKEQYLYLIENSDLLYKINNFSSVLGLVINNKPDLIEVVFEKAINDKNFKSDNYKDDVDYQQICQIVGNFKTKQTINGTVKTATKNNNLKI